MGNGLDMSHASGSPETQFNSSAWLTLVSAIVLLVYGIAVLVYRFTLPTDGWAASAGQEEGISYVENVMLFSSDLLPGDRVIALEGFAVDWLTVPLTLQQAWRTGATIDYTVIRAGQEIHVPVTLGHWRFETWLLSILRQPIKLADLLSMFFLLILAGIVFLRRPGNPTASAFLLYNAISVSNGLVTGTIPSSWPEIIDPYANFFSTSMGVAFFVVFAPAAVIRLALVFPHPKPILQRHPWLAHVPFSVGAGVQILTYRTGSILGWYWFVLSLILTVAIMLHNAMTMRDAVSRAQLRWGLGGLILSFSLSTLAILASTLGLLQLVIAPVYVNQFFSLINAAGNIVIGSSLAIAITRYRLFEIDVLIRRTLQYTLLSGLLGLIYSGSVIVFQRLAGVLTGEENSPLVTVLITLGIAALFNPLRSRIQEFIDRRFYRQKYDAEKALAQFAAAARSETDLDQLSDHLTSTVQEALKPDRLLLWMPQAKSSFSRKDGSQNAQSK